jgi:hypothetical protein
MAIVESCMTQPRFPWTRDLLFVTSLPTNRSA